MTGESIIAWRAAYGRSRAALARELGIDPHTLARWERSHGPRWLGLALGALAYGLPPRHA